MSEVSYGQHLAVLTQAMEIYIERSTARGDLWAQFDIHDSLHHLNSKLARARHAAEQMGFANETGELSKELKEELIDSLLDMINYAAFGVRHVTGQKPRV